jgi:succinoglycan biosynthesis transport protein ExoP
MRLLKVFADGKRKSDKVIAVTAITKGNGKSTIAANFARLVAHAGGKAILIDGDLRNPSLSRALAPNAAHGVVDVVSGKATLLEAVRRDPCTQLSFLPTGDTSTLVHPNEVLASAAMKELIEKLRSNYEYVVVDLPPLAPIADVRAAADIIDSYILIIEWGQTRTDVFQRNLSAAGIGPDRVLGAVINKADMSTLSSYEHHHSDYLYPNYYGGAHRPD